MMSYRSAYLKAMYPIQGMAGVLWNELGNSVMSAQVYS
jgi:DNA polymerase III alpha subunit